MEYAASHQAVKGQLMRALLIGLLSVLAAPCLAEELQVDVTSTGADGQAVQFGFDINTLSGTTNPVFSFPAFQFNGVSVSQFMANVNGTSIGLPATGTLNISNDGSGFAGMTMAGVPVSSWLWDFDIPISGVPAMNGAADPLAVLFNTPGVFQESSGSIDGIGWGGVTNVTVTPVPTSVPEPATLALFGLGFAALWVRSGRHAHRRLARV
jgi:PEP-CTERM motif